MLSYQITSVVGKHKPRKRVGRGIGSGHGKTSTRGHKGSLSRAGAGTRPTYEGGSMPLFRRLAQTRLQQRSIRHAVCRRERSRNWIFSMTAPRWECSSWSRPVLIANTKSKVKILGDGDLSKKLEVVGS